jgi:hypothetical protein
MYKDYKTMKIIATTTGGYICELSRREVALLGGTSNIGDEVDLARAFDTLDALRSLSRTNLRYLGEYISKLQSKYEEVEDAYNKTMMFDTIKNSDGNK